VTYNAKNLIAGVAYRNGAQTAIDYESEDVLVRRIKSQSSTRTAPRRPSKT